MSFYVLDTDILSLYQHNHPVVLASVAAHASDRVTTSTVTLDEQISGWLTLARAARRPHDHERAALFLVTLAKVWGRFEVVPLTVAAVARFDSLVKAKLKVRGYDLRIAAIALELGATVVTRNRRDFGRVPGLVIEDWAV